MDTAFALHRLEEDRCRVGADVLGQGRRRREHRAGKERLEAARLAGCPVTESAPSVRPWNEPSSVTIWLRPVTLRAHFSAASTDSAPELQKNACAPPKRSERAAASSLIGSVQ
jgi:hypothetical protein